MLHRRLGLLLLGICMHYPTWAASPAQQTVNPATLATVGKEPRWEIGVLTGRIETKLNRGVSAGIAPAGGYAAEAAHPVLPFFAFSYPYSDRLTLGFALDTPNYLNLFWKDHTFDVHLGGNALDLTKGGKLIARRVGPAAALRLDSNWSVGARLFAQRVDAMEDSDFTKVRGHGETYGVQLGARYVTRETLVGAAFTTRTNTDVRGSQTDIHPLVAGTLIAGDARSDILLPARLQGNFAMALRPNLWAEIELEWFDWSYVDERTVYQADGTIVNQGKNSRHYHDVINTRLGMKWQRTPQSAIYGAIGYEPTQVPDRDVTPAQTFLDRTRLTFGALWKLERDWTIDALYQYVHGHTRNVRSTTQDSFLGSDSHVYEGIYRSRSHLFRLSVTGTF